MLMKPAYPGVSHGGAVRATRLVRTSSGQLIGREYKAPAPEQTADEDLIQAALLHKPAPRDSMEPAPPGGHRLYRIVYGATLLLSLLVLISTNR